MFGAPGSCWLRPKVRAPGYHSDGGGQQDRCLALAGAVHGPRRRRRTGRLMAKLAGVALTFRIVLTDNGTHFTDPTGDGWTPEDNQGDEGGRNAVPVPL